MEAAHPDRRAFLIGSGGLALGAAAGWGATQLTAQSSHARSREFLGRQVEPWSGSHQAGITTSPQGFLALTAFSLLDGVDRERLGRLMRIWTDSISRLTQGRGGLADMEPELASFPGRLTITVGFGAGMFEKAGMLRDKPAWLQPLPLFTIDRLEERWNGGDLVLQVCCEDPSTLTHALRYLTRQARTFAKVKWVQRGYRNAAGQRPDGATFRNQFGQLDGSSNLQGEEDKFVWIDEATAPLWLQGGTAMVVRRIHMNLDTWDELDRPARETAIGRTLDSGAPITGGGEFDSADLKARNELGFPKIDAGAHIRRSRTEDDTQRMLRRPYNYDDGAAPGTHGLVFITFQKSIEHQFIPIQKRLDILDLLNIWTTPIGSAVFAVPRGVREGEWLGQDLLG